MRLLRICHFSFLTLIVSFVVVFWACSTTATVHDTKSVSPPPPLVLTFAGDIMAHDVNFAMKDYHKIYQDLFTVLHSDDFSFANIETPVADELPMSTYPRFNVHRPYLEAAFDSGFDVFSLANNHSNDQGLPGIRGTLAAVKSLPSAYANGLRASAAEPLTSFEPVLIQQREWTIVFLAVTEILNSHDSSAKHVYYSAPNERGRDLLLTRIKSIALQYPTALFVLSIHTNEPEYIRTVSEKKKRWFLELARAGVDIVWAHHPHVMQPWELVSVDGRRALFMYSMGNFISGQRYRPNLDSPTADREYTGDAVLLQVRLHTGAQTGTLHSPEIIPLPITNYRDPEYGMVVRKFSSDFYKSLSPPLSSYYRKRYTAMDAYLPLLPTTAQPSILE